MTESGDIHAAFRKAYEAIHDDFWRFCKAKCYGRMTPEDLMQDSLLIAFSKYDHIKKKQSLLSFLIGVSIKLLANDKRKIREVLEVSPLDSADKPNDSYDRSDVDLLYKCISQLPSSQGEAIILFEITGYSIKEIAEIQESGVSAVKQRLKRGREALKLMLSEDLSEVSPQSSKR